MSNLRPFPTDVCNMDNLLVTHNYFRTQTSELLKQRGEPINTN